MKAISVLSILFCSVAFGQFDATPQTRFASIVREPVSIDTIASNNARSVCLVSSPGSLGSGVYLGGGWVLTARHVIHTASGGACRWGSEVIRAENVVTSANCDSALIQLESEPSVSAQRLASVDPRQSERLYLAGFDHGSRFRVFDGVVARDSYTDSSLSEVYHSPREKAKSGDSGGPVFNERGEVIGNLISVSLYSDETQYVTNAYVRDFIRRVAERYPQYGSSLPQCGPDGCTPAPYQSPAPTLPPFVSPPPVVQPPPTTQPIKGADGKDGVDGTDGKDGVDGTPGETDLAEVRRIIREELAKLPNDGQSDIDAIAAAVIAKLPPFYPMWIDSEGNVIDEITDGVRLGQTLPLRISVVLEEAEANARARSN